MPTTGGPSRILAQPATGGSTTTIYSTPSYAITTLRVASPTTLLFGIHNPGMGSIARRALFGLSSRACVRSLAVVSSAQGFCALRECCAAFFIDTNKTINQDLSQSKYVLLLLPKIFDFSIFTGVGMICTSTRTRTSHPFNPSLNKVLLLDRCTIPCHCIDFLGEDTSQADAIILQV